MSEKVTNGGAMVNSSITKIELPDRELKRDRSFGFTVPEVIDTPKHHI